MNGKKTERHNSHVSPRCSSATVVIIRNYSYNSKNPPDHRTQTCLWPVVVHLSYARYPKVSNLVYRFSSAGIGAQTDTTAAAGLLTPLSMQNLVTLAAMTQPSLQAAAAQTPTAAITNAANSLCKYTWLETGDELFSFFSLLTFSGESLRHLRSLCVYVNPFRLSVCRLSFHGVLFDGS